MIAVVAIVNTITFCLRNLHCILPSPNLPPQTACKNKKSDDGAVFDRDEKSCI